VNTVCRWLLTKKQKRKLVLDNDKENESTSCKVPPKVHRIEKRLKSRPRNEENNESSNT